MAGPGRQDILERLRSLRLKLEPYRELLLANVVMVGEIPAPTFGEEKRIAFMQQRFTECGLQSVFRDQAGNGLGLLAGSEGDSTILLVAHADTPFSTAENHTCTIESSVIRGPGVADNSVGLAVLATLPTMLEGLGIQLKSDLLLLASAQSLEHGDQQGLRYFLKNCTRPIQFAVLVEGSPLGRLQYRSMASLGGMISCQVDRKVSQISAIEILTHLIHQLGKITLPEGTQTALVLGSVGGGASYKVPARNARLRFQLRSNTDEVVREVTGKIEAIIEDVARQEGVTAIMEVIARTTAGGLDPGHPFVQQTCKVLHALEVKPTKTIFSATVSGCVEQGIPAISIGISNGDNVNYPDEYIEIDPIPTGVAQLIGILLSLDGGCHA